MRQTLWQRLFGRTLSSSRRQRRDGRRVRPQAEFLEERLVPSTFDVNSFADTQAADLTTGQDTSGRITLRSALEAANHLGGTNTITLPGGTYNLSLNKGATDPAGGLYVGNNVNLQGVGQAVIDAQGADRVFQVPAGRTVMMMNLTIQGGMASSGGGIYNAGNLTMMNDTIAHNRAVGSSAVGGGIDNAVGAVLQITDCTISDNLAQGSDGAVSAPGTPGNSGTDGTGQDGSDGSPGGTGQTGGDAAGGGIYNVGTMTIDRSTLSDNQVIGGAGAPGGAGGGGGSGGSGAPGSTGIVGGPGGNGGAGGSGGVGGQGGNGGGASGGGIANVLYGILTIRDSTFAGNQVTGGSAGPGGTGGEGGAGGAGGAGGGGLLGRGSRGSGGNGGNGGTGGKGGDAGSSSGGALWTWGGSLTLLSSTLAFNHAAAGGGNSGGPGGGAGVRGLAAPNVSTASFNPPHDGNPGTQGSAGGFSAAGLAQGGGFFMDVAPLPIKTQFATSIPPQVENTVLAHNTAATGPDAYGIFLSLGHNFVGDGTAAVGFTPASKDQVGTSTSPLDPRLGPLENNGGPTQTMVPLPSSPLIDAGDNAGASTTDQRGLPRIADGNGTGIGVIDIGAVEVQLPAAASAPTPAPGPAPESPPPPDFSFPWLGRRKHHATRSRHARPHHARPHHAIKS
jgi:hypothetical protein